MADLDQHAQHGLSLTPQSTSLDLQRWSVADVDRQLLQRQRQVAIFFQTTQKISLETLKLPKIICCSSVNSIVLVCFVASVLVFCAINAGKCILAYACCHAWMLL